MRIRTGHGPDDWTLNDPAPQPARLHGYSASVSVLPISQMRPILRSGGNSITGGGRPPAKAMHVVPDRA